MEDPDGRCILVVVFRIMGVVVWLNWCRDSVVLWQLLVVAVCVFVYRLALFYGVVGLVRDLGNAYL